MVSEDCIASIINNYLDTSSNWLRKIIGAIFNSLEITCTQNLLPVYTDILTDE